MGIDPQTPHPREIERAVGVLQKGKVLVFPTSGLYGLGADALNPTAVQRIFSIKQRSAHMPVLVMVANDHDMQRVVKTVPAHAEPLLALWPGGITFVFEASDQVPARLTGGTGKIGVRMPAHPVARALVEQFGGPITATSANRSGYPAIASIQELDPLIGSQVDMVLDAGPLAGGVGSTILDVSAWPVRMIREGAVGRPAVADILGSEPV